MSRTLASSRHHPLDLGDRGAGHALDHRIDVVDGGLAAFLLPAAKHRHIPPHEGADFALDLFHGRGCGRGSLIGFRGSFSLDDSHAALPFTLIVITLPKSAGIATWQ